MPLGEPMEERPLFRVGAAGLDPRDSRLIEIVFKHSQYNKYEYRLTASLEQGAVDVLIVNSVAPEGLQALSLLRSAGRNVPVIAAVPRGSPSSARHAISIDRLTLQLLPILNRVVELELLSSEGAARAAAGAAPAAGPTPAPLAPGAVPLASGVRAPDPIAAALAAPQPMPIAKTSASPAAALPALQSPARAVPPPAIGQAAPAQPVRSSLPARAESAAGPSAPASRTVAPPSRSAPPAAGPSNLLAFPVSSLEPPISQRLRVLVVDDSPTVRRQLGVAFDRMGITCDSVESAAQALEKLAEQHFDLALLDVVMPDMDGYKLTRAIKRNRQWRQLPIIILTSRSSPFDLARGALAGCDTYLTKPVPYRALEAAVIKQLRRALAIDDLSGLVRTATQPVAPAMPDEPAGAPRGVMSRLFRR